VVEVVDGRADDTDATAAQHLGEVVGQHRLPGAIDPVDAHPRDPTAAEIDNLVGQSHEEPLTRRGPVPRVTVRHGSTDALEHGDEHDERDDAAADAEDLWPRP
jgi:hypothetical protein